MDPVVKRRKREGTFVQRQMAPVIADVDSRVGARMSEADSRLGARIAETDQRIGAQMNNADRVGRRIVAQVGAEGDRVVSNVQRAGRLVSRRAALGIGAGIAGGMVVGEAGRAGVRRLERRNQGPERVHTRLRKAEGMGEYPYLLPTIRQETQIGIPATRTNPISPLQMLAAANITGEGLLKVRSRNPIGRKARTKDGVHQMSIGALMGAQPLGYGVFQA